MAVFLSSASPVCAGRSVVSVSGSAPATPLSTASVSSVKTPSSFSLLYSLLPARKIFRFPHTLVFRSDAFPEPLFESVQNGLRHDARKLPREKTEMIFRCGLNYNPCSISASSLP